MKKLLIILVLSLFLASCTSKKEIITEVSSPSDNIKIAFNLNAEGQAYYQVFFNNKTVVDTSYLGFDFSNTTSLSKNLQLINSSVTSTNQTWDMVWGEQETVVNNYNVLKLELQEKTDLKRKVNIVFKAYDDGLGFRYEFPKQDNWDEALITNENTQFNLTEDYKTFWIPGDWDIYEHLYNTTKLSEVNALKYANHSNLAQTYIPENAVNTPVTMVGADGTHLSFHEAALVDYSGMTLKVDTDNFSLTSNLVGSKNTVYKVKRGLPFNTPWRTIQIAKDAPELIESKLIVNLNEPNKLGDMSWFQPMKYTGVWWEMHLGKSTWDYGMTRDDGGNWIDTGKAHGKHGATTENVKRFIDFSAKNNIKGVLVEGWNTGWEHWIGFEDREGVFDFVTPYPDYDLKEVVRYGKEKGVDIIMHHETSAATATYTKQQDAAFALMQSLGIHTVKTGYVGRILPKGEYHHGQYMVKHYNNTVEKAAKYQVAINAHEPIKATGLRRTYPNTISREGLRGQEFNAWSSDGGNPPEHLSIVAFTRMLSGPVDFTPGIFNIKFDEYKKDNQVNTTLAQQLALYVVIYSPVQMAADLVEHYEANPKPLQFIKDVGVDWSATKVLNGVVGDYVTIARKERKTGNWFLGSITDENKRSLEVKFDFLDDNQEYTAIIYKDGKNAHWNDNPLDLEIETITLKKNETLTLNLAEGGGVAISIIKK
ncbi:glycoside hydrolase family 97 protein [Olleya sp. Bg11-27]|uniref:glycoside hydrolase family 97 protein n=1 Tax=Olleya sp. Bg11-27 TaxID=2058135 RepID=UPI000C314786|nr:glycoside hydrolase family 97 protein [Olleya sp. Bg11-27]AUC74324.1 alpha-glucosidase [Olleya sp. Bg11-27]